MTMTWKNQKRHKINNGRQNKKIENQGQSHTNRNENYGVFHIFIYFMCPVKIANQLFILEKERTGLYLLQSEHILWQ